MRPQTETVVSMVNYIGGTPEMVELKLSRPNVSLTLPLDEMKSPEKVSWRLRLATGNRHVLGGSAFQPNSRGRARARWEHLLGEAPIAIDGEFQMYEEKP